MLKAMRWRFIEAAMLATFTVVSVLSLTINLWYYHLSVRRQDDILKMILNIDGNSDFSSNGHMMPPAPWGSHSPEMRYMLRFFIVYCDEEGNIANVNHEFIASVSETDAADFAVNVLGKGRNAGFYGEYRFRVKETDSGKAVAFLNSEHEIQSMKSLLLVSMAVAISSLLAIFILVLLFSSHAIVPYMRNIETQKRFITDASHELKTPLTAIATSADVLAMEYEDDEWVQNIQTQAARLAKLITNLVTLSRLDEEQPFPEKSNFSLSDAVWEIAEPISALARAKGKQYEQRIEDGIFLHGDRAAVQQMVSILLDNAIRYSNDGGTVRLNVHKRKKKAEIVVYNTCTIEDTKNIDRLFDRFYRLDPSRNSQSGGTGIGLSIAKATAEAHGGRIQVQAKAKEYIVFTVRL